MVIILETFNQDLADVYVGKTVIRSMINLRKKDIISESAQKKSDMYVNWIMNLPNENKELLANFTIWGISCIIRG